MIMFANGLSVTLDASRNERPNRYLLVSEYNSSMLPRNLHPMRVSRRSKLFDSDDYIFELKIDGCRSLAYIEDGQCDLVSRNGNTFRNFKDLSNG